MSETFKNLEDKEFTVDEDSEKWYNLSSGRKIADNAVNKKKYIMLESIKIAGTIEDFESFIDKNELSLQISKEINSKIGGKKEGDKGEKGPKKDKKKSPGKTTQQDKGDKGDKKKITKAQQEKDRKQEIKNDENEKIEKAKTWTPKTNKIEDVPYYVLDTLCDPDYRGLSVKARVVRVLDGDTIDIAFYLPHTFISTFRILSKRSGPKRNGVILGKHPFSILQTLNCRLNGIDAAEHDTEQGVAAIEVMEKKYSEKDDLVYVKFIKYEKFGRTLIDIYDNKELKGKTLNQWLVDYRDPRFKKPNDVLAVLYDGQKKCDYMKNMPKICEKKEKKDTSKKKVAIADKSSNACSIQDVCISAERDKYPDIDKYSDEEPEEFNLIDK